MKKKKRKVLTKKEKIILTCLGTFAFLIIAGVAMLPTKIKQTENNNIKNEDLRKELTGIEETVTYLEGTLLSMENSSKEGYETDIYVSFKYNLYDGNELKERYFTNFYEKIARVINFKSFRLIDKSKSITIEVKCSGKRNNRSINKRRKRIL